MTLADISEKWNRIYASNDRTNLPAANVLRENTHLLPGEGRALDVACGLGANALLLAQHGLQTCAWDISKTAIEKLILRSTELNISLLAELRNVILAPPTPASFDVIVVSHFLDRALMPHLIAALRDGGLIFYQTFIMDKISDSGPRNPDYLLRRNELLSLFRSLQIVLYREEGRLGDLQQGFRNEAILIAQKSEHHG
ncbi:MAG: tellurite methyltransferase [Gammaproteobacteria bacterium]|jgi:tellurite methyltransferase